MDDDKKVDSRIDPKSIPYNRMGNFSVDSKSVSVILIMRNLTTRTSIRGVSLVKKCVYRFDAAKIITLSSG
jgi:hypothetical protein